MNHRKFRYACVIAMTMSALWNGQPAHATDTVRCGNLLAMSGDTRDTVRSKCGEPADISHSVLERKTGTRTRTNTNGTSFEEEITVAVQVENWTYNFGKNRFMVRFQFIDGVATKIDTLGYGHD